MFYFYHNRVNNVKKKVKFTLSVISTGMSPLFFWQLSKISASVHVALIEIEKSYFMVLI